MFQTFKNLKNIIFFCFVFVLSQLRRLSKAKLSRAVLAEIWDRRRYILQANQENHVITYSYNLRRYVDIFVALLLFIFISNLCNTMITIFIKFSGFEHKLNWRLDLVSIRYCCNSQFLACISKLAFWRHGGIFLPCNFIHV